MLMRYHHGLAVGHVYTRRKTAQGAALSSTRSAEGSSAPTAELQNAAGESDSQTAGANLDLPTEADSDTEDPTLSLENLEDDLLEADDDPEHNSDAEHDDQFLIDMDDMYGPYTDFE